MRLAHLAGRFVSSLRRAEPDRDEESWLLSLLNDGEAELYRAQSVPDRRHAVACAVAARTLLGPNATTPLVVASALHDVGKTEAGLGTIGRVTATVVSVVVGDATSSRWRTAPGWRGRFGRYWNHPRRGADLLTAAQSAPPVVAWAAEHHLPASAWTLPTDIGTTLLAADES